MNLNEKVTAHFRDRFGYEPAHIVRAPGRVNLLGEHVDYNDGFVLPIAIDRATWLAFSPSQTHHTTLMAVDLSEEVSFTPETLSAKTDTAGRSLPSWALYPAGVMWALGETQLNTPALNGVYTSDVPQGSGLSSSASVEMTFALAWQTLGGWFFPPMERALLGQKAENQYVGVNCGIMDQFASACGEENSAMISRTALQNTIRRKLEANRVVEMIGPRQCGKTTLARQFVSPTSANYFDLEDPFSLARLNQPMTALQDLQGLVVIDEIQRRPELFLFCEFWRTELLCQPAS